MPTRRCCVSVAVVVCMLLSSCATYVRETGRVRIEKNTSVKSTYQVGVVASPSGGDYVGLRCLRLDSTAQTVDAEILSFRNPSWLGWTGISGVSAGLVGAGVMLLSQEKATLGRDAIGIGAVLPLAFGIKSLFPSSREWVKRDRVVAGKWIPAADEAFGVAVAGSGVEMGSYRSDKAGRISVPVGALLGSYRTGQALGINVSPESAPERTQTASVESERLEPFFRNPSLLMGPEARAALPPYPEVGMSISPRAGIVKAKESGAIKVRVRNTGKGAYYQLLGTVTSECPLLHGKRFYLGKVERGELKEYTVSFDVPEKFEAMDAPFKVGFSEANDNVPDTLTGAFYIEDLPKPQLVYSYQIIDDKSGNSVGNGDGKIQKGEAIDLEVTVKNAGSGAARGVSISMTGPKADGLEILQSGQIMGSMDPGTSKTTRLTFQCKKRYLGDKIPLQLLIKEGFWGLEVKKPLDFATEEVVAPQIMELRRIVIARETLNLMGGAGENTPAIARVPAGGTLSVTGELSGWYRVEFGEDRRGWVPTNRVEVQKSQATREEAQSVAAASSNTVVQVFQNMPPTIGVFTPGQERLEVAIPGIEVAGLITDDKAVLRYEIRVNGRPLPSGTRAFTVLPDTQAKKASGTQAVQFRETVPLDEGENLVAISAFDDDGLQTTKEIQVRRTKAVRNMWAVVIGISDYQNVPKLKYASSDAQAFRSLLVDKLQVPKEQVIMLTDQQATVDNVRRTLGDDLRRKVGKEDLVLIYFAGHGTLEDDASSPDNDGLAKYLVMWDTRSDQLYTTALPMDEIGRIFGRIDCQSMVYFGDACYAGGARSVSRPFRATPSEAFLDRLAGGKGRVIVTAASAKEVAQEDDKLKHGVFTYYLLEALSGKADSDADGFVTIDEAYLYLSKVVPEATGRAQHPVKKGEVEGSLVVGRVCE